MSTRLGGTLLPQEIPQAVDARSIFSNSRIKRSENVFNEEVLGKRDLAMTARQKPKPYSSRTK